MVGMSPLDPASRRLGDCIWRSTRPNGHCSASSEVAVGPFRREAPEDGGQDNTESWLSRRNTKGRNVYENEFPTLCPSSSRNGSYWYQWRLATGRGDSISPGSRPGFDEKQRPGLFEKQKVSARCA